MRAAEWSEINLEAGEWSIPAGRMKMGEPHIVPLMRGAAEMSGGIVRIRQWCRNCAARGAGRSQHTWDGRGRAGPGTAKGPWAGVPPSGSHGDYVYIKHIGQVANSLGKIVILIPISLFIRDVKELIVYL